MLGRAAGLAAAVGEMRAGKMAAWQIHSYGEEPRLTSARIPHLEAPDHVLVRVSAAGVNPLDVAMTGGYGRRVLGALRALDACREGRAPDALEMPLTLGRELCGVVERTGMAARVRRGQRVWAVLPPHVQGAHAQYALCRDAHVAPAPPDLSDVQAGGALYAALTAWSSLALTARLPLERVPRARPSRVLVVGAGGVGGAALQLLRAAGHTVVAGCARDAAPLAAELGADLVLERGSPEYARELRDHGPYEVVLDCAGGGGALEELRSAGVSWGVYVTLTSPLLRETDSRGVLAGSACAAVRLLRDNIQGSVRWAYFVPAAAGVAHVTRLARSGQFRTVVEREYAWSEAAAAYERVRAGHLRGKHVIRVHD